MRGALLLLLPVVAGLVLGATPRPAAGAEVRVEITDYGIYETTRVRTFEAPATVAGHGFIVDNIRHIRTTQRVLAQLDLTFGFRFRVTGDLEPGEQLTGRIIHPPLHDPESGRHGTMGQMPLSVSADGSGIRLYTFDYRWELAEGWWTFQVLRGDEVLAEKRFEVVVSLN